MTVYPAVRSELETLRRVAAGASLARYGDGEFNLCAGHAIPCQRFDPVLARRLREILEASGSCMVGIPNLLGLVGPNQICAPPEKVRFWSKYLDEAPRFLTTRAYASAFVTRPDSAPWIDTDEYWQLLKSLWAGRAVTLVCGGERSLHPDDLVAVGSHVRVIRCSSTDAFADYEKILERVGRPERAILCLGPTATVLAVDLAARGVHAIDLGHVGMFLRKRKRGEPLKVTDADRAMT